MATDFLPNLKRRLSHRTPDREPMREAGGEFFFCISRSADGSAKLTTVDASGKSVNPEPRFYRGDQAALLRSIDSIRKENRFNISWGTDDSAQAINLTLYPYLLYQLLRCDNLCDEHNNRITPATTPATLVLKIESEKNEGLLNPSWAVEVQEPEEEARLLTEFVPVTETFVLAGGKLYEVEEMGENFTNLNFFASRIAPDMIEQYLSVVYSYVDRFRLDYANAKVVMNSEEVSSRPTLVFEKVDSDMALHLRVTSSVRGVDEEFLRRFELTRLASVGMDGTITVRPLMPHRVEEDVDSVMKLIQRYAPSRKEAKEVFVDEDTFIIPHSVAGPFLLKALPVLLNDFNILGTDKLREYKVAPVKPKLSMKFTSGIDFLEGNASVEVGGEELTLGKLFEQYRRDRYVTLKDGTRAVLDDAYMRRLERIFGNKRNAGQNVRVNFFDLPDIEDLINGKIDSPVFKHQRKVYEGFNNIKKSRLKLPRLNASLRPYQSDGVKWIKYLYDNNLGGCLADDMGLGKTIQTIAILSQIYPDCTEPTLIVMPRSLLFNWQNEIARFAPSLSVYMYYHTDRDMVEAMKHNVILTTYAMVRNDIEKFSKEEFHYVILDESQNIKNIEAQTTRAIWLLNAAHKLALSGTPVENNLTELFSLFRFLNPGMLGDIDEFNRRYAGPIMRDDDKEAMASLRRRIFPFMLRRLKKDVLTELPDRVEQTLYVEMERDQAEFYEQRRRFYQEKIQTSIATEGIKKSQFVMFQALTELRRIASVPESLSDGRIHSPKLEELVEHVADAVANGHKCVVFFNYIAGLELTGEHLSRLGIDFETMTGATTNRRKVVDRFNSDPNCKVFLMTLKTGGVGLNLTVADTVFIFEPWWNKAAEEQAINRLHRIGQTAKVHSYSLITRDTIEEKIRQLQERKSQLFDDLISSDTSSSKQLSEEDINFILSK
ncbi:MAG: DEAD/DEAH box helicase [Muribaculaceae bacterium]|nr:DEAD/DEAH box helicase [Muribaculaceae bacterium]